MKACKTRSLYKGMAKKGTEIIVENDEMEDGSIFVCFMCEKEFNKVSLLNDHMQMHQNMPEMHKELPTRRRGRGRPSGSRGRGRGRPRGRGIHEFVQIKEEPIDNAVYIKSEPEDMYCPSPVKKAQRIRQYFQSRGRGRGRPKRVLPSEDADDLVDVELQLIGEEMMMIPPPSKKSGSGPTIMNAEPDGFICPPSSTFSPPAKKNVRIRKKLIVQEVVYEEIPEDEDDEDGSETNGSCSTTSQMIMKHDRNTEEDEEEEECENEETYDEDGSEEIIEVMEFPANISKKSKNYLNKRPGRRSQPRTTEEESGIPCEECGKEFRSVTTLRVHMKSHLEVKDIPCPYCDETFPQRHVLHQHLVNDHEESSNLTCPVCQKVFTRTDSLKSHMVRMHEEDGGLNCYICGKNFPSQGQLEMHVRVHTGERPFICNYCAKGFVQKVHLRTHLRTMHNMQEIQNTPCRICNAMLDGRAGLREHYSTIHGLTNNQYKSKVAKLRKEGKIPELPPPVVKEVDPSLNYYKVNVSEVMSQPTTSVTTTKTYKRKGAGKLREIRKAISSVARSVNSGTSTDEPTFDTLGVKIEEEDTPRRRDQEELNIVESAFKVAEQMDQLEGNVSGSTTILVAGEDSATTGVYYAIPVVMDNTATSTATTTAHTFLATTSIPSQQQHTSTTITNSITTNGTSMISSAPVVSSGLQEVNLGQEDIDEEYAQFAAEHSHIGSENFNADSLGNKGSIVKAEPLQLFTDPSDPSQSETVEMFTM
ncbi:myoneurin isoform X2 [Procambarus clarkii]|uniref:myoneurin isoform X2 n=2 Tax=Procambarus clarkii TaxID=6728 RepID=UPI001E67145D|nr:PR domain zinc finger protein 10-like isoform X2 [Procambarus clarkii]